ncbi:glycosyltransferase family 4 protein [Kordiimonas marina]|uniref:glycosyltransferase family 4 protein n=1 Tax=Kordiimonas marina TaxID=2872312 RepID=UPI001FF38FD0|nr:glycosyltransferase family 4 protein [Kordiimonas marina]MCJ9429514.1 glycosyltransferase family 4 protein [Kordiimonas marina]
MVRDSLHDRSTMVPCHILHVFPSFEIGGSQRRFAALAADGKDFRHTVYAMDGCYDALSLIRAGAVEQLDAEAIPKGSLWQAARTCRRILRAVKPDLLVTYNWGSIEWALANRFAPLSPMMHIQDGFGTDEQAEERLSRKLMRGFAYRAAGAVVVPSHTLEKIARENWHIRPDRLHYIPNGIDIARFDRPADGALLAEHGLKPEDKIIGTVAALRPEKNIGRLIEAFSHIAPDYPDYKLVIIGDGVGRSALKMLAERIGLKSRVIFTGTLKKPELILPAFDIMALSSDTEQMPLSVIEAMAAGLPVASTDVGDIKQMVAEENAVYVEGREAAELAANLRDLIELRDARTLVGQANKKKAVANFGIKTMAAAYDQLFDLLACHPQD